MTSSNVFIFLLFSFFIALAESDKMENVEKIIIHVPYKIHKHHHTHTKYKVITIPAPKHENTIICLKENHQQPPPPQHKPEVQMQVPHSEVPSFMPPHQQSAATLLDHLQNYQPKGKESEQNPVGHVTDQKLLETTNQNFVPSYDIQTAFIPSPPVIPQYYLKPVIPPQEQNLAPKYIINPTFHHQNNFIPNFDYQTMFQPPPQTFTSKYTVKQKPALKLPQDSVAHSTNHEYKTITPRKPKSASYKVREEVQENNKGKLHQHKITKIGVPSSGKSSKTFVHSGQKYNSKSIAKLIPSDPDYEYEHVGYLVIDGDSKKIVGKNFKDELRLRR